MRRRAERASLRSLLASVLLASACAGTSHGGSGAASAPRSIAATDAAEDCSGSPIADAQARGLVDAYCVSCHSPDGSAGEDYDFRSDVALRSRRRNIAAKLRLGAMPPPGSLQLAAAERSSLRCWAER
jgi:mono/diheme cytochrome c family protein